MRNCTTKISVFCSIGQTIKGVKPILESRFVQEGVDINLPQFIILNILHSGDDIILEDLSKRLHTDKSAILRHLNYLENLFIVAKIVDSQDKRRKVLVLTQHGVQVLMKARAVEAKLQKLLIQDIDNSSLEIFNDVLDSIKQQSMKLTLHK